MRFRMRRNFLLDMIMLLITALMGGLILLMIIGSIYSRQFINIVGVLILGTFLAFSLAWLFNTKCYIVDDVLHIQFIWSVKVIPLDKIHDVTIVSGNFKSSKMVKDGIEISYTNKYGKNSVTIAVIEEDVFVKYLKQHCNLVSK